MDHTRAGRLTVRPQDDRKLGAKKQGALQRLFRGRLFCLPDMLEISYNKHPGTPLK